MKVEKPSIFKISLNMSLSLELTEILHFWWQNQWISTKNTTLLCLDPSHSAAKAGHALQHNLHTSNNPVCILRTCTFWQLFCPVIFKENFVLCYYTEGL